MRVIRSDSEKFSLANGFLLPEKFHLLFANNWNTSFFVLVAVVKHKLFFGAMLGAYSCHNTHIFCPLEVLMISCMVDEKEDYPQPET